jgi:hypothetical protein
VKEFYGSAWWGLGTVCDRHNEGEGGKRKKEKEVGRGKKEKRP